LLKKKFGGADTPRFSVSDILCSRRHLLAAFTLCFICFLIGTFYTQVSQVSQISQTSLIEP
jgi:hypothetical protein